MDLYSDSHRMYESNKMIDSPFYNRIADSVYKDISYSIKSALSSIDVDYFPYRQSAVKYHEI